MHTDRDALLVAILAHPDEDTPRLAFADLLDEEGEGKWAARIRSEIETHRREKRDDWAALLIPYLNDWWHELEKVPPADWCTMEPPGRRFVTFAWGLCTRGFVGGISCPFTDYGRYAAAWFRKWPIQCVVLSDKRPHVTDSPQRFGWLSDAEHDIAMAEVLPREWIRDMARWGVGLSLPDASARWFDTVKEACAALSEHCVALGRQAALTGDPP